MTHAQLIHDIRLALGSAIGIVLWPNVNAALRMGGRMLRTGLIVGAADLIGIVAPHGRFLAIECKVGRDRLRPAQKRFLALVRGFGGYAGVARSVDDAWQIARGENNEEA